MAAYDIGGEALLACDDVGVFQNSQHGRRHQITRGDEFQTRRIDSASPTAVMCPRR